MATTSTVKKNWFKKKENDKKEDELINSNNKTPGVEKSIRKKKNKPIWDTQYELIDVQYPKEISNNKFKKRFKLNILYKDTSKKLRRKTVRFGLKDCKEYIDDGDLSKKHRVSGKLGNTHNMMHGNFWRLHLLNGDARTLKENYLSLLSKLN